MKSALLGKNLNEKTIIDLQNAQVKYYIMQKRMKKLTGQQNKSLIRNERTSRMKQQI